MDPQSLLLFFSLRQPRRIKVVENILRGRKTVSNLYWGMRYGILRYLNALRSVDARQDRRSLKFLLDRHDVTTSDHRNYLLTASGYQKVISLKKRWYQPRFLTYNLTYDLKRFKARFLLAIQVVSEYSYRNRNYYPIQIDYLDAELVKRWFHYSKDGDLVTRCYQFLAQFFKRLDRLEPTLGWQAVNLLIGHSDPGQTLSQQGRRLHQPVCEIMFRRLDILAVLVLTILKHPQPFGSLLNGLKTLPVSNNALRTYRLAEAHYDFRQISHIQRIRPSTVKEHLLGTAIFYSDRFPFGLFLSKPLMATLNKLYQGDPDRWDYSKYQTVMGKSLDFFYFRLYQIFRSNQDE